MDGLDRAGEWDRPAAYPAKPDATGAYGNIYNPLSLWLRFPQKSMVPPTQGLRRRQIRQTLSNLRKTLQIPRNLTGIVGLQKLWVA